jgi:hypothetical protein
MGRMSELYGDVRELFEQGLNDVEIATVTGLPITMVSDCTEQFYDELDELEGDYDFDEVAAADFAFDEIEY